MNNYKVVILAAGTGSRIGSFSKTFNKVLLPIQGKPAICHIIEKFSKDIEIVIAVGYKKETIIDYLKTAYKNRKITFLDIGKFEGEGTGPGYSLLQCKDELQCPFIQFAGDTLVKELIPEPDKNWIGVSKLNNMGRFCSVKIQDGKVIRIDDKVKNNNEYAFIGLFGTKDYKIFWETLENKKELISGKIQVSNGLQALLNKDFFVKDFTWFDTGTPESYEHAIINYPHGAGYHGK